VGVLPGIREALDPHALTADGGDEIAEIGRRGGDGERRRYEERQQQRYFLTKIDFGIMQWMPLRMSTIWVTRQSPTIDTSA